MRWVVRLSILGGLALIARCVCTSVRVTNMTSEPVFINTLNGEKYGFSENSGQLVQPNKTFDYANYGEGFRVRNMRGETVLYSAGDYAEDKTHNIVSLEADPAAPLVGQPFSWGLGASNAWSATVCDTGSTRNIKEFGLWVDVRNGQDRPLLVEIFERFSDHDEPRENQGAFAPAGGEATVSELVVAEPWLRAFDQNGTLVYTTPLQLEESQTVTIRSGPLTVKEIPRQNIGRTGCGGFSSIVLLIAFVIAPIVLVIGGVFLLVWVITLTRRRGGKVY
jgi:hypothetical protein